ncbi:MAG: Holliday junction ATP-dependent helicase ruvA [Bacteriovoracaceae bacterium]|nr:Holliday junction ATP-dependent helicase ruvA [Bacteriovoracaceae bacterium]
MIAQLTGKILFKSTTSSVIDCSGVGYEVFHTPFTAEKLSGESASLFIYSHIREDAFQLFGFFSTEERSLFKELLRVSGVGPKSALSILSGLPYEELLGAIASKDKSRLQNIPGIGKKTAERLMVELSDRLKDLPQSISTSTPRRESRTTELESVLLHLGYQKNEIQRAVNGLKSKNDSFDELPLEALVKSTLKELTQVKSI